MDKAKKQIEKYIKFEEQHRNSILIVLVANVEDKTLIVDDYSSDSLLSEYYTLDEFEIISTNYKKLGYEVVCYFSEHEFINAITNNKLNCDKNILVINTAQTGTYVGRKSLIPSFCESLKIMHTGSNPYVVSLCRDKFHSNSIIVPFTDYPLETYLFEHNNSWLCNIKPKQGERYIIKLNSESASIGMSSDNIIIYNGEQSDNLIYNISEKYNQSIVIQRFVSGFEVELPIIMSNSKVALPPVGISQKGNPSMGDQILDYSARFNHLYDFYNYHELNKNISYKLQNEAIRVATLLGIEGFGRIDFRIDTDGQYYVSDIATNPHITTDSSFAYSFCILGYSYSEMFSCMIGSTLVKYYKSLQ